MSAKRRGGGLKPLSLDELAVYQRATWDNPAGWAYRALDVRLWSKQQQVLEALRDYPRVACRSSNAAGKSFVAAIAAIWYLQARVPSYVVTTSSSWTGVERVIWPEITQLVHNAPFDLSGQLLRTEWRLGEQWGAFGVSADTPENFAGFRTPRGVLVIVDEASAIREEIYDAIMGLTATEGSRVLMIGNPLRPEGPFYESFSSAAWHQIHISAFDTPNVRAGRNIIPGLATLEWIEERKLEWGVEHPAYLARVLGEFPEGTVNSVIPLMWAESALTRPVPGIIGEKWLGVDVARFGDDRTVLVLRDPLAVRHLETHTREDTMQTVGRVVNAMQTRNIPADHVMIDDTGLGGGVTDRLREMGHQVQAVNNGATASDKQQFANVRAESYWRLREALNPLGRDSLAIPEQYKALVYECASPTYHFTPKGQILLRPKSEIKKRLGRSPDLADALALTYAIVPDTSISFWMDEDEGEPGGVHDEAIWTEY